MGSNALVLKYDETMHQDGEYRTADTGGLLRGLQALLLQTAAALRDISKGLMSAPPGT